MHQSFFSILFCINYFKFSFFSSNKISCFILISISMSSLIKINTYNNWFVPTFNLNWNIFANDRFSKNSSIQIISNSSVGRSPHFFQFKFLYSSFIRGYSCACNSNLIILIFKKSVLYIIVLPWRHQWLLNH
jgi:hypothetical protein